MQFSDDIFDETFKDDIITVKSIGAVSDKMNGPEDNSSIDGHGDSQVSHIYLPSLRDLPFPAPADRQHSILSLEEELAFTDALRKQDDDSVSHSVASTVMGSLSISSTQMDQQIGQKTGTLDKQPQQKKSLESSVSGSLIVQSILDKNVGPSFQGISSSERQSTLSRMSCSESAYIEPQLDMRPEELRGIKTRFILNVDPRKFYLDPADKSNTLTDLSTSAFSHGSAKLLSAKKPCARNPQLAVLRPVKNSVRLNQSFKVTMKRSHVSPFEPQRGDL